MTFLEHSMRSERPIISYIWKVMIRSILIGLLLMASASTRAQITEVGSGGVKRTSLGPMNADTVANAYGRYAYLYPKSVLGDIQHGDSVVSIAFKHADNPELIGSSSFKIYIKNSSRTDFGSSSLNWNAEVRNGMTLVYSSSGTIPLSSGLGYSTFKFNAVDFVRFDTSGGAENLEILIESTHTSAQATPHAWFFENGTTVPGLISVFGTKYVSGTGTKDSICGNSSLLRPTMRLLFPRDSNDVYLHSVFTTRVVPLVVASDQDVLVHLVNAGVNAISTQALYLQSFGVNQAKDTLLLPTLQPGEEYLARFSALKPLHAGNDVVYVSTSDTKGKNNAKQVNRQVSYDQFSHLALNTPSTAFYQELADSAKYAIRFKANGSVRLKTLTLRLNSIGVPYQIGVWNATVDGKPGSLIYRSSTQNSSPGTFMHPFPTVDVQGYYFVGLIQTGSSQVKLNVVDYDPLIPEHIYSQKGNEAWRDFSTRENLAFFAELTVQPPNELKIVEPVGIADNDSIVYNPSDSFSFGVRVANLGYLIQQNFGVAFQMIDAAGDTVYRDTVYTTLVAGDSTTVFFDSFANDFLGRFKIHLNIISPFDPIVGNNTLSLDVVYVADVDLALNYNFEPWYNDTFIVNQQRFEPRLRVINLGATKVSNFAVIVQLKKGDLVLTADTQHTSLNPGFSQILSFDTMAVAVPGDLMFVSYIVYEPDTFTSNDSLIVPIFGKLIRDVSLDSSLAPLPGDRFLKGAPVQPFVRAQNNGVEDLNNFFLKLHVFKEGNRVFRDSSVVSVQHGNQVDFALKSFVVNELGVYILRYIVFSPDDQYSANDTLEVMIRCVRNNDVLLERVLTPQPNQTLARDTSSIYPRIVIYNPGFLDLDSIPVFVVITKGSDTVYRDTASIDLLSGHGDTVQFERPFSIDRWGDFHFSAFHSHPAEVEFDASDSLDTDFFIRHRNDLSVLDVITPKNNDSIVLGGVVNTKITLGNAGIETLYENSVAYRIVDDTNRVHLVDTLFYGRLISGETINLQADTFFRPTLTGRYTVEVFNSQMDDSASNDTMNIVFYVYKPVDLLVKQALLPKRTDSLPIQKTYAPSVRVANEGIHDAELVTVDCRVVVNGEVIYNKSQLIAVQAGETLDVRFDSSLTYDVISQAKARFLVVAQGDMYNANDSVWVDFNFVKNTAGVSDPLFSIQAFPNPFDSRITLVSPYPVKRVIVFNAFGEIVYERYTTGRQLDIELLGSSGLYIIQLDTDRGTVYHKVLKH